MMLMGDDSSFLDKDGFVWLELQLKWFLPDRLTNRQFIWGKKLDKLQKLSLIKQENPHQQVLMFMSSYGCHSFSRINYLYLFTAAKQTNGHYYGADKDTIWWLQ